MKLLYFFDPLCGWCYAFQPVLRQLRNEFPEIPLEIHCGGMYRGNHTGPIGDKGRYIVNLIPRLEQMTGCTFGDPYKGLLEDGSLFCDSLKPSIAMTAVNDLAPDKTLFFLELLQASMFLEGCDLQDNSLYARLAEKAEIRTDEFNQKFHSPQTEKMTLADFDFTNWVGISGFPTLVAEKDLKMYLITQGYAPAEQVNRAVAELLDMQLK